MILNSRMVSSSWLHYPQFYQYFSKIRHVLISLPSERLASLHFANYNLIIIIFLFFIHFFFCKSKGYYRELYKVLWMKNLRIEVIGLKKLMGELVNRMFVTVSLKFRFIYIFFLLENNINHILRPHLTG
jgi:hypothetical protein